MTHFKTHSQKSAAHKNMTWLSNFSLRGWAGPSDTQVCLKQAIKKSIFHSMSLLKTYCYIIKPLQTKSTFLQMECWFNWPCKQYKAYEKFESSRGLLAKCSVMRTKCVKLTEDLCWLHHEVAIYYINLQINLLFDLWTDSSGMARITGESILVWDLCIYFLGSSWQTID